MKDFLIKVCIVLIAIFSPAKQVLGTVMTLIIVDLVTGIWASKKQQIPITSAALGRTGAKSFVYLSAVLLAFLVETYLTTSAIPCMHIVASFLGLTELLSCLENINIIGGGDLLKKVIDTLSSKNSRL